MNIPRRSCRSQPRHTIWLFGMFAWCVVVLGGCWHRGDSASETLESAQHRSPDDVQIERLIELIAERLEIMHEVARWKWQAKRPIEDPVREAALLEKIESEAAAHHLEPGWVRDFFEAQIAAGKLVQQTDFKRWESQPAEPPTADLERDLRPRIDRLNVELLEALVPCMPRLTEPSFQNKLARKSSEVFSHSGIGPDVQQVALQPLLGSVVESRQ